MAVVPSLRRVDGENAAGAAAAAGSVIPMIRDAPPWSTQRRDGKGALSQGVSSSFMTSFSGSSMPCSVGYIEAARTEQDGRCVSRPYGRYRRPRRRDGSGRFDDTQPLAK